MTLTTDLRESLSDAVGVAHLALWVIEQDRHGEHPWLFPLHPDGPTPIFDGMVRDRLRRDERGRFRAVPSDLAAHTAAGLRLLDAAIGRAS